MIGNPLDLAGDEFRRDVLDLTTVNDRIMTDGNIIPDPHFRLLIRGMDHYAVLDVDLIPDMDAPHVSSYHGVEPDTAVIPDLYLTHDSCIRCNETTMAKVRDLPFYRQNNWHGFFSNLRTLLHDERE